MNDRTWLLRDTAALNCAKSCIRIIKKDFGIKLTLSDAELLPKIGKINENVESDELNKTYHQLLDFAGIEPPQTAAEIIHNISHSIQDASHHLLEKIELHGKQYPRFDKAGREFKGVYRGHVRYG